MLDTVAEYNQGRWNALAQTGAVFTRPALELDAPSAQDYLDAQGRLGTIEGKRVLCLASGGGQQSVAFALLGAQVVVHDLSNAQIETDRLAAAHYGVALRAEVGDMRDLARYPDASFDIVYQPYSLNFVPDPRVVFREVARVLAVGGIYYLSCANPCFLGLHWDEWNGKGYPLHLPYLQGAEVVTQDPRWVFREELPNELPPPCREYKHTLGTLLTGLAQAGLALFEAEEMHYGEPDFNAAPGTSEHFTTIAPPWLCFWSRRTV